MRPGLPAFFLKQARMKEHVTGRTGEDIEHEKAAEIVDLAGLFITAIKEKFFRASF
jgi:hypothetical protein